MLSQVDEAAVALVLAAAFLNRMAVWQLPAALQRRQPPWPGDAVTRGARRHQKHCPGRRVLSAAPPCCTCTHISLVKLPSYRDQIMRAWHASGATTC